MAGAQGVLMPQPQISTTPQAVRDAQNPEMDVFGADTFLASLASINPFVWGPVMLHPHVNYRVLSGSGIRSSTNNQESSIVQTFTPGMLFTLGTHWTLDYTPSLTFYSNDQFRDTLSHSASLSFGTSYEDWALSFSQSYSRSSESLAETATQTDQQSFGTSVGASYRLNDKMSVDMSLNQNINETAGFNSSRQWSTMAWLNYEYAARLNFGIGLGGGYVDQEMGSDQVYEQLQARINWRATDKTSVQLHGGLENRQFLDGSSGNVPNPTFGLSVQYQPFQFTQISLGANRSISTSYFTGDITESTGVNLSLRQRLLEKFFFNLGGSYSTVDYVSSSGDNSISRSDETYSFNTGLNYNFWKRATASVSYQYSDHSSSSSGFQYTSSQVSFDIGYRF